jgi:hypothetical protein
MANARKRISELPPLNVASLDTTFVLGISGSTTYKISINNLTSSLDGTFATDLVTNALSTSLDSKLSTSSFQSFSSSVHQRILDATNEQSFNGLISGSSQLTSSYDERYVISGSITQTTWDNIANKPAGIVSQSTDLSSLNSKTGSYATTGSNEFNGNQTINGIIQGTSSLYLKADSNDNRHFEIYNTSPSDTHIKSNGGISFFGDDTNYVKIDDSAGDVTIAAFSDIILTTDDGGVYIGSYGSGNGVVTNGYLNTIIGDTDIINGGTGNSITDAIGRIPTIPDGTISGSEQIADLGFVTGSYAFLTEFNSLTQSFNIISGSVVNITNAVDVTQLNNTTASLNSFSQSANTSISNLNAATSSYLTSLNGAISSSSQLTSSFDTRYVVSGSISAVPAGTISGSSQLSGTTIPNLSGSFTGSFRGNITGVASQSDLVKTLNSNLNQDYSLIFAASGSNGYMQTYTDGIAASGSVLYNPSTNRLKSAYLQGEIEATNGVISGSSQLTSSFDSRYVLESETGSLQTSITNLNSFTQSFSTSVDSRFDTLEATIISGSPNYTQVLGNRRTSITTVGVSVISGSITTTGNPVQIMVTGDANPITTAWCRLQIFRDGSGIGNIIQVENSSNLNVPYCLNVIDTPPAGTYTYSMRTVDTMSGTFDFGEFNGPLLTALELKTNTNLPSTNNTFTGTNTFTNTTTLKGAVTIGTGSADEGGQIDFAYAQNTTLTGSILAMDVYQNRIRIFEGGGNARGVHIDLTKAPVGVAGELMWKTSGMVGAGTFVTLDNLKCAVTTVAQGNRGLSIGAVSTTFEADVSGWYTVAGGNGGLTGNNYTYTTTASNSLFNWNFPTHGDMVNVNLRDKTNNRFYRITMMMGASYISNFISIERLF